VGLLGWLAIRNNAALGLATALIILPVLPAIAALRIYPQGDMTHDRYLYLPSVGLCLAAALLIKHLWAMGKPAKTAVAWMAVALVAACSALAFVQQKYYQDDFAFYRRIIYINPSDGLAYCFLGNIYLDQGRTDAALESFRKAREVAPDEPKVGMSVASGLYAAGKNQEAEAVLEHVLKDLKIDSRRRNTARLSLANIELASGQLGEAQESLQEVEASDRNFPLLHWTLGALLERQGRLAEAQAEYAKEFQITGDEASKKKSERLERAIRSQQP
jgi:Flp pilus assembly protein TadD